jgi:hypothetical protein
MRTRWVSGWPKGNARVVEVQPQYHSRGRNGQQDWTQSLQVEDQQLAVVEKVVGDQQSAYLLAVVEEEMVA